MEKYQNLIEKTANYEGDHTLLFLERLNNPEIKKKLIESLAREYIFIHHKVITEEVEVNMEEIRREEEQKLDSRIKKVFNSTEINLDERKFSPGYGALGEEGIVCPFAKNMGNEGYYSKKELNITEAHEKGHGIREFKENSPVGKWVESAFDFSKVALSERDLAMIGQFYEKIEKKPEFDSKEELTKYFCDGLKNNPDELVERMSQLKNYFGMKGSEKFTKEHLDYVRNNYLLDKGFMWRIQIKPFFDAITKDTEKNFLDVINNLGV